LEVCTVFEGFGVKTKNMEAYECRAFEAAEQAEARCAEKENEVSKLKAQLEAAVADRDRIDELEGMSCIASFCQPAA
jgi:hypothetical protein